MKNINKLKNGKWQFSMIINGKRHRKNFSTKTDAITYASNFNNARKFDLSFFQQLSGDQIKDIKDTLAILPKGKTLHSIVSDYIKRNSFDVSMKKAFELYKEHFISIGKNPKLRIQSFIEHFKEWDNVNENVLLEWLKLRGMPKTILHYFSQIKRFYEFSKRRKLIVNAPTDNISSEDFPIIKRSDIAIWQINEVELFFKFLQEQKPKYANWFAIACFAGIRRAEISRLKPEYIDLNKKTILLPYNITKTGDTWLMEDLPSNLWLWLEKYGTNIPKMYNTGFDIVTNEWIKWVSNYDVKTEWKHNICRHSFCTYHLSLYRNPSKTSLLLRHREPNTMWQHYLAKLVDKETAKKYFEIIP